MKCTCCGSKSLLKISLNDLFYVQGDASLKVSNTLEVYSCGECGHIELFDNSFKIKLQEEKKITEEFAGGLKELSQKRDFIRDGKLQELNEKLSATKQQLTSLDITIRQQQELQKKVEDLNNEIKGVSNEIRKIEREITILEEKKKCALQEIEKIHNSRFPRW